MVPHLLEALHHSARDEVAWLALADALEEADDPRAEMLRLTCALRGRLKRADRAGREQRLQGLLAAGMHPAVPELTVSLGMRLALIPPGTFRMGARRRENFAEADEFPRHEVVISRPFYLGVTHVTQRQYQELTGRNPSTFVPGTHYPVHDTSTADYPVDGIGYEMAVEFCGLLSALQQEKAAGRAYRLPTEAEWEYACRAGTSTVFAFGDTLTSRQANFDGNYAYGRSGRGRYLRRTCPVGSYAPNAFGLYDMHGLLWEWCADCYGPDYYASSPRVDPPGPREGPPGVLRGGSWIDAGWHCRCADRSGREASHYVGLRVAMSVPSGGGR